MCKKGFLCGMAVGVVVGVTAELVTCPRPKCRKTAVGQAMQRMGNALDSAMVSVAKKLECSRRRSRGGHGAFQKVPCPQFVSIFTIYVLTMGKNLV